MKTLDAAFLIFLHVLILAAIVAFYCYGNPADAAQYPKRIEVVLGPGTATAYDGDTFTLRYPDGDNMLKVRVRLSGVNSPEMRDKFYNDEGDEIPVSLQAKFELQGLLADGGKLACVKTMRDSYDRAVMQCSVDDQDIGMAMVRGGWAAHEGRFTRKDENYAAMLDKAEAEAREDNLGIWAFENGGRR